MSGHSSHRRRKLDRIGSNQMSLDVAYVDPEPVGYSLVTHRAELAAHVQLARALV